MAFHPRQRPRPGPVADARAQPPARELSADLYRVVAVAIIVIGHWLLSAVTYRDGHFGYDEVLAELPWTHWLTWFFQVVPVFFVVGGYANAASWTRWRAEERLRRDWLRHRCAGILGPATAYVASMWAVVAVSSGSGLAASQLAMPMWVVALQLWFLPVYLAVAALTPLAVAAQHRWGLKVPAALAAAVAVVDVVTRVGHVPLLGSVNYALCWGAIHQFGVAWFGGALRGRRAGLLALGGATVLVTVVALGRYPVSMIGVRGQSIQNTTPPNVALLALAAVQAGLLVAAAPAVTARLRRARWLPQLALANQNAMALYLWHMVPVVVVALACYPTGWLPQPELGSGTWWLWRLGWIVVLTLVTAGELTLLWFGRSFFARPTPAVAIRLPARWSEPMLVAGTVLAAGALWRFSSTGFAPGGHLPLPGMLSYAAGIILVSLYPIGIRRELGSAGKEPRTDDRTRP